MANVNAVEQIQGEVLKSVDPRRSANQTARETHLNIFQQKGARAAMEAMNGRRTFGVTETMRDTAVRQNIFVDLNVRANTRERQNQEAKRLAVTDTIMETSAYVARGLEGVTDADTQTAMREQVENRVGAIPGVSEAFQRLSATDRDRYIEGLLNSSDLKREANILLQQQVNRDLTQELAQKMATVTPAMIADRIIRDRITGVDDAEKQQKARNAIENETRSRLEAEWASQLENIPGEAVARLVERSYEAGEEAMNKKGTEIDRQMRQEAEKKNVQVADEVLIKLKGRWEVNDKGRRREHIDGDFNTFASRGLEGVLANAGIPNEQISVIMENPDLREKYESQLTNMLLSKRARDGRLNMDDVYKLIDAPWCGQEKFIKIMEGNDLLREKRKEWEDKGYVHRGFWHEVGRLPRNDFAKIMAVLLGLAAVSAVIAGGPVIAAGLGVSGLVGGLGAGAGVVTAGAAGESGVAAFKNRRSGMG